MESSDLSSGAQKSPEPDFGKKSPEPKRRKLDVLGDDYQPNVYIESEVDGTGNDSGEEDMSTEAYLAYLGGCTADRPKSILLQLRRRNFLIRPFLSMLQLNCKCKECC